jgi:pyruvate ferredoxin oxidoreductase gamma subunit
MTMYEIRLHGRGGQGVVTAAELLSVAAFAEGRYAQAFPSFGSERTGAPVAAFCRIDDKVIRLREPVRRPDAVIVQDTTLLQHVDVLAGLVRHGLVLLNTTLDIFDRAPAGARVYLVPATQLALDHVGRPVPNAALLGGFAAASGLVTIDSVAAAIRERFTSGRGSGAAGNSAVAEGNVAAALAAYEFVRAQSEEPAHA